MLKDCDQHHAYCSIVHLMQQTMKYINTHKQTTIIRLTYNLTRAATITPKSCIMWSIASVITSTTYTYTFNISCRMQQQARSRTIIPMFTLNKSINRCNFNTRSFLTSSTYYIIIKCTLVSNISSYCISLNYRSS